MSELIIPILPTRDSAQASCRSAHDPLTTSCVSAWPGVQRPGRSCRLWSGAPWPVGQSRSYFWSPQAV